MTVIAQPEVRYGTAAARWIVAATVLGSGIAFLDGTVVNVALPAITRTSTRRAGLQWIVNAYLVTLSALLLLGGSLGDRFGRRTRVRRRRCGLHRRVACSAASRRRRGCSIAARALQGVGGALLVPGSLAIIAATFHPDDRGRAIGAWSGLAGVASSIGPFLGGWLIDAVRWRLVFLINVPLAVGRDRHHRCGTCPRPRAVAARPARRPRRGARSRSASPASRTAR